MAGCPSCGQRGHDITSMNDIGSRYVCVNLNCPRDRGIEWTEEHEPHYDPTGARRAETNPP
jgi:hypothetical protein